MVIYFLGWLWKQVAEYFGIEYQGFVENNSNLEIMQNDDTIWRKILRNII
jgi:hypothetical protein